MCASITKALPGSPLLSEDPGGWPLQQFTELQWTWVGAGSGEGLCPGIRGASWWWRMAGGREAVSWRRAPRQFSTSKKRMRAWEPRGACRVISKFILNQQQCLLTSLHHCAAGYQVWKGHLCLKFVTQCGRKSGIKWGKPPNRFFSDVT